MTLGMLVRLFCGLLAMSFRPKHPSCGVSVHGFVSSAFVRVREKIGWFAEREECLKTFDKFTRIDTWILGRMLVDRERVGAHP